MIGDLQKSPCFAIICTTDLSTTKQLIIYIKAIVNNQVQTSFLALEQLCDGSSNSIVQCLKDTMVKHGLNMSNLAALGSDGASAMVGIHNGVSAQLKCEQPTLHCVAHRLPWQ